jgi:DNA-binding response OmpR family regulator
MFRVEPPTLIVVEDEEVVSLFLRESLGEMGFCVRSFADAETAADAVEAQSFDAAVIDVGLPQQTGDELARQWRERHPDLPIILATGYDETRFTVSFAGDSKTRVLAKPFDLPRLLLKLDELGVHTPVH